MQVRYKLVPSHDGTVTAVLQYKWLGLIWRDKGLINGKLHKVQWEIMDLERKLHAKVREMEDLEKESKQKVQEVHNFGDRLKATGPSFDKPGAPIFVHHDQFVAAPPNAELKKIVESIKDKDRMDPDDLGIDWPPKDHLKGTTRSAFVLGQHFNEAIAHGIVRVGEPYSHVLKYFKPKDNNQNNNNRKKGGSQNQNNQGGNNGGN